MEKSELKKDGSSGTHNGMRNIVQLLATENFPRVRIGTDKPKFNMNLADYVLQPFSKEEEEIIEKGISNAAMAAEKVVSVGIQKTMNEFNKM